MEVALASLLRRPFEESAGRPAGSSVMGQTEGAARHGGRRPGLIVAGHRFLGGEGLGRSRRRVRRHLRLWSTSATEAEPSR